MPEKLAEMHKRYKELAQTRYEAKTTPTDAEKCAQYVADHRGFMGPYLGEG